MVISVDVVQITLRRRVSGSLTDFKHTKNQGNRASASTTLEANDITHSMESKSERLTGTVRAETPPRIAAAKVKREKARITITREF